MNKRWAYCIAVFLGAFLLFQVEPMMSKALLPAFGGSYLVWGGCMVFYQVALLLGYAYAHATQRVFGAYRYARWHSLLLLAPLLSYPFDFAALSGLSPRGPLVLAVFANLAVAVGLPFVALSTVSVLLQRWYSIDPAVDRRNPYMLYSASNLGSMLGLLSYPLIVEPLCSLSTQGRIWWVAYGLLVALHFVCRPRGEAVDAASAGGASGAAVPPEALPARRLGAWFLLSLTGTAALLAVTNVITIDIASVPFLWVLPLAVYLLTFILVFRDRAWFPAGLRNGFAWAVILGLLLVLMSRLHLTVPAAVNLALQLGILFVVCMNCHGEIARTRPADARRLTAYYLVMATGGAVGSMLVTWWLPLVSSWLVEYPLSLLLAVAGLALVRTGAGAARPRAGVFVAGSALAVLALTALPAGLVRAALPANIVLLIVAVPVMLYLLGAARHLPAFGLAVLVVATAMGWTEQSAGSGREIHRQRNYYGIYRVYEADGQRFLQHGTTSHGSQLTEGPDAGMPVAYYHPAAPAPRLLSSRVLPTRDLGMIGLGTGALPCFAARGDRFTIYELDPDNLPIARRYFTYLAVAEARGVTLDFVFGDGRIGLRTVAAGSYDMFVVDAFNSGSIPVHLLTREAIAEYLRVLRPEGVLLLHISNRILDLRPVIQSLAAAAGADVAFQEVVEDEAAHIADSSWAVLSLTPSTIDTLVGQLGWSRAAPPERMPAPWTDQYSNLLSAMF